MVKRGMAKQGMASVPGTCGELVQGSIDGRDFLISCPVDMWSTVYVYTDTDIYTIGPDDRNETRDSSKSDQNTRIVSHSIATVKIRRAIEHVKRLQKLEKVSVVYNRRSDLVPGKGMGSSTADIVAAYYAACALWSRVPTASEAADVALQIEPSDSTMFSGLTMFDHMKGSWREFIGEAPEVDILMIDPGGFVSTVEFHQAKILRGKRQGHLEDVRVALEYVVEGVRGGDVEKIAKGATLSAFANQTLLFKEHLCEVGRICEQLGGLGVNVAHSGTVMGILFEPGHLEGQEAIEYVRRRFMGWNMYWTKLISGGVRIGESGNR